jgi:hypothetical protein
VTDGKSPSTRLEQWVSTGATIIAPATVLGALLFYFGYVSSRSQYAYFGIDVDTIGLSTQDYIMRSPQPLLVPLLVLTLIGLGFLTLNIKIRRLITSAVRRTAQDANIADPGANPTQHINRIRHMMQSSRLLGLAMLTIGVVLLFSYAYVRDWTLYALVTPLLIAFGAALTAYASSLLKLQQNLQRQQATATVEDPGRPTPAQTDGSVIARWTINVLVYVVIGASIFWATATIAQWSGLGLAEYEAQHLDNLPSVILDTKERLFLRDGPIIEETILPYSEGQTFHYRYRGLRLLIESQNRMFLVPDEWSASDSTLIVPLDGSVRVQFQFQNQPP